MLNIYRCKKTGADYHLRHLLDYLLFPSYTACTVGTVANQALKVLENNQDGSGVLLTTFEWVIIFFTRCDALEMRKSNPCWK